MRDFYSGKRVLVTGGIGFIGSNLALRLVELGAEVMLVDSMLPAYGATLRNIEPVRDRVRINFSDVRDRHSMRYLVRGHELIFSLAGQVSHVDSMTDPATDLEINCASQLSLLECCREGNPGVGIVFASTRQLYGRPRYLPVDEEHPKEPVDVNGINNLAAEMYYGLYHQVHGLKTVSLRLTNTYGPRMDLAHPDQGVRRGVPAPGAGRRDDPRVRRPASRSRDFNHVDDVVDALLLAGAASRRSWARVYNLGHPEPRSLQRRSCRYLHRVDRLPTTRWCPGRRTRRRSTSAITTATSERVSPGPPVGIA